MSYEIESTTDTKPVRIKCEPLIVPLTDKTGKWNTEALKWFSGSQETKGEV